MVIMNNFYIINYKLIKIKLLQLTLMIVIKYKTNINKLIKLLIILYKNAYIYIYIIIF